MAIINLNPNKRKSYDLDELLRTDVSATKDEDVSRVPNSDTEFSATNSDTKDGDKEISATNSDTNSSSYGQYMNQYKSDHYDMIRINVPKGYKDLLKTEATKRGMSLTKLVVNAVVEYVKNHPV